MNCKLIAGELLCAAVLLGCSTAPTLSLPSGDWEEVSQPNANAFNSTSVPVTAYVPPKLTGPVPSSGQANPKLGAVTPVSKTSPLASAVPAVPSDSSSVVSSNKDFPPAPKAPVPATAGVKTKTHSQAPKASPPPPPPKPVWSAAVGQSLRSVITSWSQRANYTLAWQAEDLDYPIDAPLRFEGTYEEAVSSVFELYEQADRSFKVDGRPPQHRLTVSEDLDKQKRTHK